VRITTAYDEHNVASAIFSTIHECGHATYEHQVDRKYEGTSIARDISSGMHESQSRFFENYLGRRKSFWVRLYPKLQKLFPENLGSVSLDDFVKAINVSRPSLIRTEADELTYPLHILVRYEIERGVFSGKISTDGLNETWKKMYEEYLGVKVPNDTDGILQDTHWSDGSFGYFPTYALGSAIGAQILSRMEEDIDLDALLEKGQFAKVKEYLRKNIQHDGALYDYQTILEHYMGKRFDARYFVRYLKKKYRKLYGIK
ncbi:MAG: carboxypeptidase M32, partial [Erysipelotrichaceae bacterium]|nr:carboxypeptidase M32 [Erysipelotrichaceae bacterium]